MAILSYKTRGNSSPQGKERVYFTCHPADFETYFAPTCADIFKTQNCAIWYRTDLEEAQSESVYRQTDPAWSAEELAADLGQMQLFVIPVTASFLKIPNLAKDVEFTFALEHHIPILPIIEEPGLEDAFNKLCGDLQCLDTQAGVVDLTAIPYEEKLRKFLDSVLLGDDLAAKVRDAFDAYIFLSYRKKDRKYAQELMQLIHKRPFCRDIAIWYDEFLTPGENFNDAIREAMEKSNLFAMVVTPNLVNEDNYVMKVEYPKARSVGMPVLPAQMAETDLEALQQHYDAISGYGIIDAHDDMALGEALDRSLKPALSEEQLKRIQSLALSDVDAAEDPQHIFFIGLAYLDGIDVEKDSVRGVELISRAADARLKEAIEKLVSMYRNGDGVARDYETAILWQEKLKDYYRKQYEQSTTAIDGDNYFHALWTLSEYVWEMKQKERSLALSNEILLLAQEFAGRFGRTTDLRYEAIALGKLGDFCEWEGDVENAQLYFENALHITEQMAENPSQEWDRDLLSHYIRLGRLCQGQWKYEEALDYLNHALSLAKKIDGEKRTKDSQQNIALCYSYLGDFYKQKKDYSTATEYYTLFQQMTSDLSDEFGTLYLKRLAGVAENKLAEVYRETGDLDQAWGYYAKSLRVSLKQAEEENTPENRRDIAVAYENLGAICYQLQMYSQALTYQLNSLGIRKRLLQETDTPEARRDLSITYEKLGEIYMAEKELSDATTYFEKCAEIRETLLEETGLPEQMRDLAIIYEKLSDVYDKCRLDKDALECRTCMVNLWGDLADIRETEENLDMLARGEFQLGESYEKLGEVDLARRDYTNALVCFKASAEGWENLLKKTGAEKYLKYLALVYEKLGAVYHKMREDELASEYAQMADIIRKNL